MKTKLFFPLMFVICSIAFGQTIVSTTPENKNVVMEIIDGYNCSQSPDGHNIANNIQEDNPGDVFIIEIHAGSFAVPNNGGRDFRTIYGDALKAQSGMTGYPAGIVNRTNFPGLEQGNISGITAMSRPNWANAANQILGQSAYVNIGMEAVIDIQTNEMVVHVEAYYTGNSPQSSNLLNIALLQNNTFGPQAGGVAGDMYVHQHRLVHLLTGQWGVPVNTTTTGSFINQTFTYTIPAAYRNVPVRLEDLELVAFIAEDHQTIAQGAGTFPTFIGLQNTNDASLLSIEDIPDNCLGEVSPKILVKNLGQNTITSLDISYSLNNGNANIYTWTGNLPAYYEDVIELPAINFSAQENNLEISLPTDENISNNTGAIDFNKAVDGTTTVYFHYDHVGYTYGVTWDIKNHNGDILYFSDIYNSGYDLDLIFELPSGCYTFSIYDYYGDGDEIITLIDSNGTLLYESDGNYGFGEFKNFSTDGFLDTNDNSLTSISIYPNPSSGIVNITNAENSNLEVYNLLGQLINYKNNLMDNEKIDFSNYTSGIYILKLVLGSVSVTKKVIVE